MYSFETPNFPFRFEARGLKAGVRQHSEETACPWEKTKCFKGESDRLRTLESYPEHSNQNNDVCVRASPSKDHTLERAMDSLAVK